MFIYPTTVRRITSGFRPPNRTNHHGVDFADSGTHEIVAAAAGTVTRSYRSPSYGECIILRHTVNGEIWETLYAHMLKGSRKAVQGETVKQGQVIGIMGNTGQSTGQHLHFELHRGTWNVAKSNAVNPLDYLQEGQNATANERKLSGMIPNWADWQWKEAASIYKRARENQILSSDQWEKKAAAKNLTFDELEYLNLVLNGRRL